MKLEIKKNSFGTDMLWIDDVPAFQFWLKGEQKNPVTPSGWDAYVRNKEQVDRWLAMAPTLRGRLSQPLTTEKEAVKQLKEIGGVELSERAKEILNDEV